MQHSSQNWTQKGWQDWLHIWRYACKAIYSSNSTFAKIHSDDLPIWDYVSLIDLKYILKGLICNATGLKQDRCLHHPEIDKTPPDIQGIATSLTELTKMVLTLGNQTQQFIDEVKQKDFQLTYMSNELIATKAE